MADMEKISVRIPIDDLEDLEDIVLRKRYRNVSDAVRAAVEEFIKRNRPGGPSVIELKIPEGLEIYMDDLIEMELFSDYNEIIVHALRTYLENNLMKMEATLESIERAKKMAWRRKALSLERRGRLPEGDL